MGMRMPLGGSRRTKRRSIHPCAWKRNSTKFISNILHKTARLEVEDGRFLRPATVFERKRDNPLAFPGSALMRATFAHPELAEASRVIRYHLRTTTPFRFLAVAGGWRRR